MQAGMGITDGIIQGKISCFRNKFHKHKEKCSEKRKFLGALCLRSEKHRDCGASFILGIYLSRSFLSTFCSIIARTFRGSPNSVMNPSAS